jgi:hypothetical protein
MNHSTEVPGKSPSGTGRALRAPSTAGSATRFDVACRMAWIAWLGLSAGCAVPVHQQRLVSKPSMQFSDSPVFNYQSRLLSQIEPGAAASGGAQAAGCTSCR